MTEAHDSFPSSLCSIKIHNFSCKISEKLVAFQVTQLKGQILIWIAEGEPSLTNLAVGVPVKDSPSTTLLGASDSQSSKLASMLSKKLNKQVFCSFNLEDDILTTPQVIGRLLEEIKQFPEKF